MEKNNSRWFPRRPKKAVALLTLTNFLPPNPGRTLTKNPYPPSNNETKMAFSLSAHDLTKKSKNIRELASVPFWNNWCLRQLKLPD